MPAAPVAVDKEVAYGFTGLTIAKRKMILTMQPVMVTSAASSANISVARFSSKVFPPARAPIRALLTTWCLKHGRRAELGLRRQHEAVVQGDPTPSTLR
jgi:hypothetical protein